MNYNNPVLRMLETHLKKETENKNTIKANAYKKAITNLRGVVINKIEDVSKIPGVGPKIKQKIQTVIDEASPETMDEDLTAVYGIGDSTIRTLRTLGFTKISQLYDNLSHLNKKQQIGLKYHPELTYRIPYDEMVEHEDYIQNQLRGLPNIKCISVVGSYRRGKETSGDIDVLINSSDPNKDMLSKIIQILKDNNYVLEVLAGKDKKFMGIVKLPEKENTYARRLDILITPPEEFAFAQLYFTGSRDHNIMMRNKAREMGYTLNEHRIQNLQDTDKVTPYMAKEEDIFKFLNLEYVEPALREK